MRGWIAGAVFIVVLLALVFTSSESTRVAREDANPPATTGMAPMRQVRLIALVTENVRRYSNGLALLNVVDKARGY